MKKTSILIVASIEYDNDYKHEILRAKNELKEYFGSRLVMKESMESSFPVVAINAELTIEDVANLNEMFSEDRATKLLILCHEEDAMDSEILYVQ